MLDIDLFALRVNAQLPRFVSWKPDPDACLFNAFSVSWEKFIPYIFPPFSLLGKVLTKIQQNKVFKAIVIAPCWATCPWYPTLLSMLIQTPISLPRQQHTAPSTTDYTRTSRVVCLRSQFSSSGFSQRSAELIINSWRSGTNKQYTSSWTTFTRWCSSRSLYPFQTSLSEVAAFLTREFDLENSYTLNAAKSMLINHYRTD